MTEISQITAIHKKSALKMTSKTEASLTAPECTMVKENEMLTQLKQEIQDAQRAFTLMEAFEVNLKKAQNRLT